ncbi:MAG: ABC transporter permease [Chloroflexota bacterium]|nr:ABC transporter permease [Chloroflexota bacterium]
MWTLPVLWLILTVTFGLMHAAPGGPWNAQVKGKYWTPGEQASFYRRYALDKPLHVQYVSYLRNALQLDFGYSYYYLNRTPSELILRGLPYSATVGLFGLALAVVAGIGVGTLSALRQNSVPDYLSLLAVTVINAVPAFVLGIFLLVLFTSRLPLVPILWTDWRNYVLPSVTLGASSAAFIARMTRASILEVVRQDYVRTARAKGILERTINTRHILRNALIPIVTLMGPALAGFLTGSVIIETMFNVPGIGYLFIQSVRNRDYPLILATTTMYTAFITAGNLLVDLTYGLVDPRIRGSLGRQQ